MLISRAVHCPRFLDKRQSDVEKYIGGPDGDVEDALRRVQDALAYVLLISAIQLPRHLTFCSTRRKYRYMDANLAQRRRGLEEKVPDIRKTLTMVEYLNERRVSGLFLLR